MPLSSFSQSNAVFTTPNAILRSDIGMHCWNTAPFFFLNNMHGKNLKPTKPKRTSIFVSYRVCSLVSVMNYVSGLSSREEWVFLRERYPAPAPDFPAPIKKERNLPSHVICQWHLFHSWRYAYSVKELHVSKIEHVLLLKQFQFFNHLNMSLDLQRKDE